MYSISAVALPFVIKMRNVALFLLTSLCFNFLDHFAIFHAGVV